MFKMFRDMGNKHLVAGYNYWQKIRKLKKEEKETKTTL